VGVFSPEKKEAKVNMEVKEDDEPTNPCICVCVPGCKRGETVIADLPYPEGGGIVTTTVPTMESLPKTYLANYTLQEIGSNEDEWEVDTVELPWDELGGES
jgi:hypothetical protein